MRDTTHSMAVPAPVSQARFDTVVGVAAVTTLALVVPFVVATYPVLFGVVAPLVGAALVQ